MTLKTDRPRRSLLGRLGRLPTWTVLLAVVALGGALRFYQVGTTPPGLYQDEAYNGLDALDILAGSHPIYFPANNGREPLFIYLEAAGVAVFWPTPPALRFSAALVRTPLIAAPLFPCPALYKPPVWAFSGGPV